MAARDHQTATLAIIGGSGFDAFPELEKDSPEPERQQALIIDTPFGASAPIQRGSLHGQSLAFLPRHGPGHKLAPHRINYRANIWALNELGLRRILAINAVGGIREDLAPGALVLPDQIIDYSYGRAHSFFEGDEAGVMHAEFGEPYSPAWRQDLLRVAARQGLAIIDGGVYGCTQGPRLETAAEIRRLQRDGCDMVGMTGMPEAALARELGLEYASLAVVVNWAAGLSADPIRLETIFAQLAESMETVKQFIDHLAQGSE